MKFTTDSLKNLVIHMCEEVFQYSNYPKSEQHYHLQNQNKKLWSRVRKGKFKVVCDDFDFAQMNLSKKNITEIDGRKAVCFGPTNQSFVHYLKQGTVPNFGTYEESFLEQYYEFSCFFNGKTCADLNENCIVRYFVNSHFEDGNDNWIVTSPDDSELIAMFIHSD